MAETIRKQIIDAVVAALRSSTGINYVTTKKEAWWDWDISRLPAVCVTADPEEKRKRLAYPNSGDDMDAELELDILGYAFDINNDLSVKRTDMIRNIESAIAKSTTLDDLTLDVIPQTVETDQGTLENYCISHSKFLAKYIYNHAAP
jgi:hypothetical protein